MRDKGFGGENAMTTPNDQLQPDRDAPKDQAGRTTVLIVGAGPTGLMMACQLTRFGIPFRIIEKNSGPTTQSRALAVQARSLEVFAQMGVAQRAVQEGKVAKAVDYVVKGK